MWATERKAGLASCMVKRPLIRTGSGWSDARNTFLFIFSEHFHRINFSVCV